MRIEGRDKGIEKEREEGREEEKEEGRRGRRGRRGGRKGERRGGRKRGRKGGGGEGGEGGTVGGGEGGHSHSRPSTGCTCSFNSQFIAQRIQEGEQKLFVAKAEVQTPVKFSGRTQHFSGNSNHVSTVDRIEGFDWLDKVRAPYFGHILLFGLLPSGLY